MKSNAVLKPVPEPVDDVAADETRILAEADAAQAELDAATGETEALTAAATRAQEEFDRDPNPATFQEQAISAAKAKLARDRVAAVATAVAERRAAGERIRKMRELDEARAWLTANPIDGEITRCELVFEQSRRNIVAAVEVVLVRTEAIRKKAEDANALAKQLGQPQTFREWNPGHVFQTIQQRIGKSDAYDTRDAHLGVDLVASTIHARFIDVIGGGR